MSILTTKQIKIAAIMASVAVVTQINNTNTEEEWIAAQIKDAKVKGYDMTNPKAEKAAESLGLKLTEEECETILENKDKVDLKEKYKVDFCKSKKLKM